MVPVELDCLNVCSFGGDCAGVVLGKVTTDCDPCSFGFVLLWLDGADNLRVGDCPALWYLVLVDEFDGVCAFDPAV